MWKKWWPNQQHRASTSTLEKANNLPPFLSLAQKALCISQPFVSSIRRELSLSTLIQYQKEKKKKKKNTSYPPVVSLHHGVLTTHSKDSLLHVSCPCRQWMNFDFFACLWCDHHLQEPKASNIPLTNEKLQGLKHTGKTYRHIFSKQQSNTIKGDLTC